MQDIAPIAFRPEEAAKMLGIGRTYVYELIRSGDLESVKIGRARLVPAAALDKFFSGLIREQIG